MAKYMILQRVDAFIDYVAEIEANSAHEAAQLASDGSIERKWFRRSEEEFDARSYVALASDGIPIDSTQCGDF